MITPTNKSKLSKSRSRLVQGANEGVDVVIRARVRTVLTCVRQHCLSPEEPSAPNPGCPTGLIRDGSPLSCTCSLSTPGTPPASLVWSHDPADGATFTKTVTSQDDGSYFTCQAKWGGRVIKQASYTLRVACEWSVHGHVRIESASKVRSC